jgi:hypothetical protein
MLTTPLRRAIRHALVAGLLGAVAVPVLSAGPVQASAQGKAAGQAVRSAGIEHLTDGPALHRKLSAAQRRRLTTLATRVAGLEEVSAPGSALAPGEVPRLVIDPTGHFSDSERDAARFLHERHGMNVFLRRPRGTREGGLTSDILADGQRWDVYTPVTSSVQTILGTVEWKGGQVHGGGVLIDLRNSRVDRAALGSPAELLARVRASGANVQSALYLDRDQSTHPLTDSGPPA